MSRALPKYNKRRVAFIGGAAAVVLSGAVIAGSALAGETSEKKDTTAARTLASPGTISCPDVASRLPDVPASARAEVDRNLALLQKQIQEANTRLVNTVGQGGPNFVDNAILGPLQGKRASTIERIAISIGRTAAKPQGLESLAGCVLNAGGGAGNAGDGAGNAENNGNAGDNNAGDMGNAGNNGNGNGNAGGGAGNAAVGTITCPDVASRLPDVPASAQAEVDRNLALLQKQIQEANTRLVNTVGQGGPNFVDNAILGPLQSKRVATINRIATAIGRTADRPQGLDALAGCALNK
ncbi:MULTISPECIES: hypothetical protein [unclassified Streptomyces]|uniref:hypothetical protein n=1 Tax=unclassified Streptomyces TaxID=2593676 RepID=UPI003D7438FB